MLLCHRVYVCSIRFLSIIAIYAAMTFHWQSIYTYTYIHPCRSFSLALVFFSPALAEHTECVLSV